MGMQVLDNSLLPPCLLTRQSGPVYMLIFQKGNIDFVTLVHIQFYITWVQECIIHCLLATEICINYLIEL